MSSDSSFTRTRHSNLERFLQCVTPSVPSRTLPQNCISGLNSLCQPLCKDKIEYFTLGDLWDCYGEWSAFGVGTPVLLNTGEIVEQYYVPYLSAIQIYCNKSVTSRNQREDGDSTGFESDSWSDDGGSEKLSRSFSNNSSKAWSVVSEDSCFELESSCPANDKLGCLYLHYVEVSSPYWRPPLVNKIKELAHDLPAIMTLKSVDLSPASWMAVAWYPIYHIPCRKNERDLSSSFLTYHTLSSSFQDEDNCAGRETELEEKSTLDIAGRISLPPFGLATYKMEGDLWLDQKASGYERIADLYSAADSWLRQLSVYHHDFNFFTQHCARYPGPPANRHEKSPLCHGSGF